MADIGLSAFSLFFMQSESFLAHRRRLERGQGASNCHTLFGMKKMPTDNYIRPMLDQVSPEALQPCFDQVIEHLRERDGLKAFQRLSGRTLIALDGTEYRYRWIEGVPLRDGKDAMSVDWLGVGILDAKGKTTYDGAS